MNIYSFDIFDTLITRKTATPEGIFALIQEELNNNEKYYKISGYIKENFYNLRINSEILARHSYCCDSNNEDITIEQIYEAMYMTASITKEQLIELINLEKEIEYKNVVGIQCNINKIKELINDKKNVILISDMYLSDEAIRKLLTKIDNVFTDIPIYVSSKYKKSKWSGNLYKEVKKIQGIEYSNWIHYGDNIISDIESARKHGIKAEQYKFEELKEYENNILNSNMNNVLFQLSIGTSRNIRLNEECNEAKSIGASIGASILFPYVWWIVNSSKEKGIKRLYFIARDGYILKKIADSIINEYKYDIETHYIYGSRLAWRIPSINEKNNDLYKLMRWSYANKINTIEALSKFFQLPINDFIKYLPYEYRKPETIISELSVVNLVKKLNDNIEFKEYLINYHKEKRELVVQYLKQEVNTEDDNFAFVELAGGGYTQGCLAHIISEFYKNKIKTFFFKLDRVNLMKNCTYYNFIPSYLELNLIIEMICRAPHGQTIGYRLKEGKILPVLGESEGEALINHGFNDYVSGVESFTKEYIAIINKMQKHGYSIELLLKYMNYITKTPNESILNFFAKMPNSLSGREKTVIEFAPILSKKELRDLFLINPQKFYSKYKGSSIEYSLMRLSDKEKAIVEKYKRYSTSWVGNLIKRSTYIINYKKDYRLAANFPCELLGDKVIIYGAGKFGSDLFRKIKYTTNKKIVKWIDKNSDKYKWKIQNVSKVDSIYNTDYDCIVIAILNEEIAMSVKEILLKNNVKEEKIIWMNFNNIWK